MFWENIDQATQRLCNSYLKYNGNAVHIVEVTPDGRVICNVLRYNMRELISLESDLWHNFRDHIPVGFVNTTAGVFNIERRPARTVVHGLSRQNTSVEHFIAEGGYFERTDSNIDRIVECYRGDIADSWEGNFPSVTVAVNALARNPGLTSVALSSTYMLSRTQGGTIRIFRGKKEIGFISLDNELVYLLKSFSFFREELSEMIPNNIPVMEI